MFRKFMLLAGVVGMISAAFADTIIPGGNVSGTWAASGSPYLIQGEITVPSGQTLNIQPGVQVIFQGHYKLIVNGLLEAIGTEADSILFTASNTTTGWWGIRLNSASYSSQLAYCRIEYGIADGPGWEDYLGGGVLCNGSSPTIQHCSIIHCFAHSGGGIECLNSNAYISSNAIQQNSAHNGGGISCESASPTIINNALGWNVSIFRGGGIECYNESNPLIIGNIIFNNATGMPDSAWGIGGGIDCIWASAIITNNLIYSNSSLAGGSGIECFFADTTIITGNTIISNTHNGISSYGSSPVISNCILWGNALNQIYVESGNPPQVTYSDIQNGWLGTGNISTNPLFVTGSNGNYYLSQIAAGQSQQSPCVDSGNPASPMITGTTRTDGVQDAGIMDMGYHYAAFAPPPPPSPLWIDLTLLSSPILPPSGGVVQYRISVGNDSTAPLPVEVWVMVTLPGGAVFGPVVGPASFIFQPNWTAFRDRNLIVGAAAPTGIYWIVGYVGDHDWLNPVVFDADSVLFTKTGMDAMAGDPWLLDSGESFDVGAQRAAPLQNEGAQSAAADAPTLYGALPNPFNPTTVASFQLPVASHVSLRVYDTAGRLVTTLVDGWRQAGAHEVTFDGSGLAAGIYFVRLEAGEYVGVEKLILLK